MHIVKSKDGEAFAVVFQCFKSKSRNKLRSYPA